MSDVSEVDYYLIQYSTSFEPDLWLDAAKYNSKYMRGATVALSPYANYTFRVRAGNSVGLSDVWDHSNVCSTPPDVPYRNPSDVVAEGNQPNNVVIYWTVSMTMWLYTGL